MHRFPSGTVPSHASRPARADGHIAVDGTRAVGEPRLHLLGYGDWTGPACATIIGVGRPARDAAAQIADFLARH
ncbi:MAG: hypothetical protein U1C73_04730 [Dietzia sp.]|nr:hypothetical protein [Dietzia sp.]